MAQKTMRKELYRLCKDLDDEQRERVFDLARRLADDGPAESLTEGDSGPSYIAAADREEYERRRQAKRDKKTSYSP